jgi:hypothetical protein
VDSSGVALYLRNNPLPGYYRGLRGCFTVSILTVTIHEAIDDFNGRAMVFENSPLLSFIRSGGF